MLVHNVEGFEFEFTANPAARHYQPEPTFEFQFEIRFRNNTGTPVQLVSRRVIVKDGDGHNIIEKDTSKKKSAVELNPGDTLKFHGNCPIPTPVGSIVCEVMVKNRDKTTRMIVSPSFNLIDVTALH